MNYIKFANMNLELVFILLFIAFELLLNYLKLKKIMATQTQHATDLAALTLLVQGIGTKVDALKTALANAGNTTPEVDAAMADLTNAVSTVNSSLP